MVRLVNYLLYQVGWLACVMGTSYGYEYAGVGLALALIGLHLLLSNDWTTQLKLVTLAGLVGVVVDVILLASGVYWFPEGAIVDWFPPPFMTVLWMQFATTFQYCMSWMSGRYAISSLFGLLGAPIAFFAGERLGAIEFYEPRLLHFAMLGLLWSIAVPLLIYLSDRLAAGAKVRATYRWQVAVAN